MSASRVMWGQIAVVFAIVLLAVWIATQWIAWRLGFRRRRRLIAIVMADPFHLVFHVSLVTAFRDLARIVLEKDADAGPLFVRVWPFAVIVVDMAAGVFRREADLEIVVEVGAMRGHPFELPSHALPEAFDLGERRTETATNVTSRCARCTIMPSLWSAIKEQLGQPCSQPGASMKCWTSS